MATKAGRFCTVSACPSLAAPGCRGRCRAHFRQAEHARGSSSARGYGASTGWPDRRRQYLAAHPTCDECSAPATEPDHVVTVREGRRRGWSWAQIHADGNLRPKCKRHHSSRTAREQSGWSIG